MSKETVLIRSAAGAIDHEDKILLVRHKLLKKWQIPGYLQEIGESIQQTVQREIKEELGLDLVAGPLISIYSQSKMKFLMTPLTVASKRLWTGRNSRDKLYLDDKKSRDEFRFPSQNMPHTKTCFRMENDCAKIFCTTDNCTDAWNGFESSRNAEKKGNTSNEFRKNR